MDIRATAHLPDVRLHDLRHTVGTYPGQSGTNAFAVRHLLRHNDSVRRLSDHVGERIVVGLAGRKSGEVVVLKRGV
jgi:hypothetical protein